LDLARSSNQSIHPPQASQVYLYVSLEASNIKRRLEKKKTLQRAVSNDTGSHCFPLEILSRVVGFFLSGAARLASNIRRSEWVRFATVFGYLLFLLLLGAFAMMGFEGWDFIEGFYFASFCMTTSKSIASNF
jgi:hypothetical protein